MTSHPMGRYSFLFVCFLVLVSCGYAITEQEQNALGSILAAFPSLATVTVFDRYKPDDDETDYGAPWTNDFSQLCSGSDGWQFFGVRCANGHIDKIRFTNGWGNLDSGSPLNLAGLTSLTEYESVDGSEVFVSGEVELMKAIVLDTRVVKMSVGPTAPFEVIGASTSLKILSASVSTSSSRAAFLQGSIIEELAIQFTEESIPFDMSNLENVTQTLKKFEIVRNGYAAASLDNFSSISLPVLESLKLYFTTTASELHWVASAQLKTLALVPTMSTYLQTIEVTGPNLEALEINSPKATNLTLNTGPSLLALKIDCSLLQIFTFVPTNKLEYLEVLHWSPSTFPFSLSSLTSLATLSFETTNLDAYASLVSMGLQNLPKLKKLNVFAARTTQEQFQSLLCSIPNSGLFNSLKLTFPSQSTTLNMPSCLRSQTMTELDFFKVHLTLSSLVQLPPTLEEFILRSSTLVVTNEQEWTDFSTAVPNIAIFSLLTISGVSGPLPFDALLRWRRLQSLNLKNNNFDGTIPAGFFNEMPSLEYVWLGENPLTGTVPWYGLQNLVLLSLSHTLMTDWPGIVGEGDYKMKQLDLSFSTFERIPSDSDFSKLSQLQILDLRDNQGRLSGPLPAFWKNSPKIWQLHFDTNAFSGTFPSPINAPRLRILSAGNNTLCGSLPSFQNVAVDQLDLSMNRLSGSIPADWVSQFSPSTILKLMDNLLNGSLPRNGWYGTRALRQNFFLGLSKNDFDGPMFDLGHMPPRSSFWISYTLINSCQEDPNIGPNIVACDTSNMPLGRSPCDGCELNYPCRIAACVLGYPSIPLPPPRNYTCAGETPRETPPGLPSAPVCPQPIPTNLVCRNGAWVSIMPPSTSLITIPPNSGTIQISGNFTAGTISFDGLGTSINITGCAYIDEEIVIELEEAVKEGEPPILLIQQSDGCPIPLNSLTVSLNQQQSNSCKKIKATTEGSTATTLVVAFKIDSSGCNTKWIILGSVLGAVVVIGVIVAILVFTLNSKARDCIRPHSQRGKTN
jgi:hypothetical protein